MGNDGKTGREMNLTSENTSGPNDGGQKNNHMTLQDSLGVRFISPMHSHPTLTTFNTTWQTPRRKVEEGVLPTDTVRTQFEMMNNELTVKASNLVPHGNFAQFLASSVASLGELRPKNE